MQTVPVHQFSRITPAILAQSIKPLIEREADRLKRNLERAERKGLPATLTLAQWLQILARYKWACAFCRGPYESIEHMTRLADGGGTTADNCCPCCLSCNQQRGKFADQEVQIRHTNSQLVS